MIDIINYSGDDRVLDKVFGRSQLDDKILNARVLEIVNDVADNGDSALFKYIERFDGGMPGGTLTVSEERIEKACASVPEALKESMKRAKDNILEYHFKQRERFSDYTYTRGKSKLGWKYRPLNKVGLYVPGGKASYPSSVLMCALPAIAAGVGEIVMATPNPSNPLILAAARECGISKIYQMGGAHAVAAMAYGTESVQRVDIIAGPGNVYVALAKKAVYGKVAIDMIAGPSEILIIADKTANPRFLAADMLSQAEHDEMSASILICTDSDLAKTVSVELEAQLNKLTREETAGKSIADNGAIVVVKDIDTAIAISDRIAPEHLELCIENASETAEKIRNAGAIFIGNYTPEPLGDYFAGASHCLPTSGSARYFSVLNVDTFMKKISCTEYAASDMLSAADDVIALAECEGLGAHANSIKLRKDELSKK